MFSLKLRGLKRSRAYKGFSEVSIAIPQLRSSRLVGAHPLPEEEGRDKGSGTGGKRICTDELESLLLQLKSWEGGLVTTSLLQNLTILATSPSPSQWPQRKSSSQSGSLACCQPAAAIMSALLPTSRLLFWAATCFACSQRSSGLGEEAKLDHVLLMVYFLIYWRPVKLPAQS